MNNSFSVEIESTLIDSAGDSTCVDALTANEKRQLVARIAASQQLNKSVRLTELLTYLTEKSITGMVSGLREQEIGANLFGRDQDYDTSQDNIVRVQVSQLRKKLAVYFNQQGREEPVIIDIPRGGYLPVFIVRSQPSTESGKESGTDPELAPPGKNAKLQSLLTQTRRILLPLLIALTVVLAGLTLWLWKQRQRQFSALATASHTSHTVGSDASAPSERTSVRALWRAILNKDRQTDLVLADSTLTILQDHGGRPLSIDEMLQRKFGDALPSSLTTEKRNDILSIVDRRYTSFTDVELVGKILQIHHLNQPVPTFNIARDYQMRAFKTNNVILLGSKRSNPWVELLEPEMNFRFHYPDRQRDPIIINGRPRDGEKSNYIPGPNGTGYSVVAFLPNLSRTGAVLILEGDNAVSTEAAGEFVSSEEHLARLFSRIGYVASNTSPPPWFEVLLRTERLQGVTRSFQIVSHRLTEK
jgi:hypothetical protein